MSHEQAEALGFRRVQALQKHTEQLWGTLGVDIVQLTLCVLSWLLLVFPSTFSVNLQIQIQEMEVLSQQCIFLLDSAFCTHLK